MHKAVLEGKLQAKNFVKTKKDWSQYSTLFAFIGLVFVFSIITPSFVGWTNIANILSQSAILALVAIGLTFVIASGGIDLSVAAYYDVGALVSIISLQAGLGWIPALLLGIVAGALVGAFNGAFVVITKINPFLVTLGTLFIIESVEKIITTGGESIYLSRMDDLFKWLGQGSILLITTASGGRIDFKFSIILVIVIGVIAHMLLKKTIFGRRLFALGFQKEAAALSGVPVGRYTIYAFIVCAVICSFAGMIGASVLSSFTPGSGRYYLLDAIGAVFIGSTLHKRGSANILGTLIGVLIFITVSNGLNIAGVNYYWQNVARGILIFGILLLDSYLAKKRRKMK
ncbi:ABC transporter permease [Bacillus sp. FJAT-50079]|uniref:ABC transporter permease n=1 Tax=Bacillus sp. FJAT-50079 TaxID=2833577 RepID=UPI001BC9D646|nr:ABC transporter permease [Bacillus sp. FJAT-50079]MBS4206531.1 ABC transporter permease [Bacillus sp. FJAT-50079]